MVPWIHDHTLIMITVTLYVSENFRCTFETACTMRGIGTETIGTFSWTKNSGKTASDTTGPNNAIEGSHYVYIETSSPRRQNDVARLVTSTTIRGAGCLRFYYLAYGYHIGNLQVLLSTDRNGVNGQMQWQLITPNSNSKFFKRSSSWLLGRVLPYLAW